MICLQIILAMAGAVVIDCCVLWAVPKLATLRAWIRDPKGLS